MFGTVVEPASEGGPPTRIARGRLTAQSRRCSILSGENLTVWSMFGAPSPEEMGAGLAWRSDGIHPVGRAARAEEVGTRVRREGDPTRRTHLRRVGGVPLARREEGRRSGTVFAGDLHAVAAGSQWIDPAAGDGGDLLGLCRNRLVHLRHPTPAVGARRNRDSRATFRVGTEDVRHDGGPQARGVCGDGTSGRVRRTFAQDARTPRGR